MTATTVDGPAERQFRVHLQTLRQHQKSGVGAPPYSRFVNRPAGRVIAAAAATTSITPNAVSAISFTLSAAGVAAIVVGGFTWKAAIVAAPLLVVAYMFDSADGQLARLRGGGSLYGEWLDHALDVIKICGLHLGIAVATLRFGGQLGRGATYLAMAFCVVAVTNFFVLILTDLLRRQAGILPAPGGARRSTALSMLLLGVDWGVLCWWMLTLGAPSLFIFGYAVLFGANAVYLVASMALKSKELRAQG